MKDKVGTVISISALTLSSDTPRKLGATCFLLGKSAIRHAWNQAYADGEWIIVDAGVAEEKFHLTLPYDVHII